MKMLLHLDLSIAVILPYVITNRKKTIPMFFANHYLQFSKTDQNALFF